MGMATSPVPQTFNVTKCHIEKSTSDPPYMGVDTYKSEGPVFAWISGNVVT